MPTQTPDTNAPENAPAPNKIVYKLEPCDKVATLYVMDQKYELPTDTTYPE